MRLVRFEPFGLARDFDRLFADLGPRSLRDEWVPSIDVVEKEGELVVRVEAPGVDPGSIDVTVEGDALVISGSRHFEDEVKENGYQRKELFEGEFTRTILLPEGVDVESIAAASKDGILTVTVPKSPEVLPRKVKIAIEQ
jgi:HSP20 family protein